MHAICNECREGIQQRRRSLTVSTESSIESEIRVLVSQNRELIDDQQFESTTITHTGQRRRSLTFSANLLVESESRPLPMGNRELRIDDPPPEVIL